MVHNFPTVLNVMLHHSQHNCKMSANVHLHIATKRSHRSHQQVLRLLIRLGFELTAWRPQQDVQRSCNALGRNWICPTCTQETDPVNASTVTKLTAYDLILNSTF